MLNCQEMLEIILREMLRKEINEVIPLQLEVNEIRLTSPEQSPPNVVRITSTWTENERMLPKKSLDLQPVWESESESQWNFSLPDSLQWVPFKYSRCTTNEIP